MRDRVDQDELDYDTQQGQWKPYRDDEGERIDYAYQHEEQCNKEWRNE